METTQPEAQFQPEPTVEQPANWKRFVLDILETLILAVVLYFGINAVSARVRVDGFSMRPTLQDGDGLAGCTIPCGLLGDLNALGKR